MVLQEIDADRSFQASVLFMVETALSLDLVMNFYIHHTWANENSHAILSRDVHQKFSLNVSAGIVKDSLLDTYILPEGLNGSIYSTLLQEI